MSTRRLKNILSPDYEAYVRNVKDGLNGKAELRGPAGLFKSRANHIFCWKMLEICGNNITHCPFDEITFHRKGTTGTSAEITAGTKDLIQELIGDYPALKKLSFSNK
jgi:L-iduronidase